MMHADLLRRLLPTASLDGAARCLGAELVADGAALDAALWWADEMLAEMDPRLTVVMLADWERVYGLSFDILHVLTPFLDVNFILDVSPLVSLEDASVMSFETVSSVASMSSQERHAALVMKVTMRGGQTPAFFIWLAASIGYVITITEFSPVTTEFDTEQPTRDEQWRYVWQVNAALTNLRESTSEDDTEMATAVWGNDLLESTINRYKPAHTLVVFSYS